MPNITITNSDRVFAPLSQLGPFEVYNSPLSEYAVMGFEFGYSVANLNALVAWEAQYGDFSNGGQIITDQFISSAESKWNQTVGTGAAFAAWAGRRRTGAFQRPPGTVLAAFGREQYASGLSDNSGAVFPCAAPADEESGAQASVVMTPKSLLRHPKVISWAGEFTDRSVFQPVLADWTIAEASAVRKILICTGKIYYELLAARDAKKLTDTAIVRMEQLYPCPEAEFSEVLRRYPAASQVVWVQEEPRNMGAWAFVRGYIQPILDRQGRTIGYAGRPESASPSPGSMKRHIQEQAQLIEEAFAPPTVERKRNKRLLRRRRRQQA